MFNAANVKPRFQTEKLNRMVPRVKVKHVANKGFEYSTVSEPGGFMVYFPQGHSLHVRTQKELERLGFNKGPGLVDMESGEELGEMNLSLKQHVARSTRVRSADEEPQSLEELDAAEDVDLGDVDVENPLDEKETT